MSKTELVKRAKMELRVTNAVFDNEVESIINACISDLKLAGIIKINNSDPLIQRAIVLYVKANFGYSDDSEKFQRSYDMLKISLCLAGDYNGKGIC